MPEGNDSTTTARPMTAAELRERAAAISRDAEAMRRMAAELDRTAEEARRPKCPRLRDGEHVVLTFSKFMSGVDYRFAAVGFRKGHSVRFTITGTEARRFTWAGFIAWVGEANWSTLCMATDGVRIGPEPGQEPPVAEVMAPFGQVRRTDFVASFTEQARNSDKQDAMLRAYGGQPRIVAEEFARQRYSDGDF